MRWAEWILRLLVTPSRPARRMPRLAVLPLEDRAVPHNGEVHATEPPAAANPAVVKEETPPAPTDIAGTETPLPADGVIKGEEPTAEPSPDKPRPPDEVIKAEQGTAEPVSDENIVFTTQVIDDVKRDVDGGAPADNHATDDHPAEEHPAEQPLPVDPEAEAQAADGQPVLYTMAPAAQPKAPFPQIGDKVWKDTNGNGLQDPGEPGVPFVTLQLYKASTLVGTTTTNGAGEFAFNRWIVTNGTADPADDGLQANTAYQVRVAGDQPALVGLRPTATNKGTGDPGELTDSDATVGANGAVLDLTLGADELYSHFDIGYTTAATIGNLVWHDANNNGRKDRTELGIPGVAVRLLNEAGTTQVATTTTGADGSYLFTGLMPWTYVVEVASGNVGTGSALAGTASSTGKPGQAGGGPVEGLGMPGPDVKADGTDTGTLVNGTVRSQPVTLGADDGMTNKAVDFGFFHSATLTGKVFVDQNANGRIDPEDTTGVANVKVRVSGPAGTFAAFTDNTGTYTIGAIPAGAYTVTEVTQPAGYRNSTPNVSTASVAGGGSATINFGESRMVDLKLGQTANRATVRVGGILTLTYRLRNLGTLNATGVLVTAPLPAGFKYVGSEVAGSAQYDAAGQRITVGTLAAGAEVVVKVRVQSTRAGTNRLRALAQAMEGEDNVRNNTAAVVVTTTPTAGAAPVATALSATGRTSNWMLGSAYR